MAVKLRILLPFLAVLSLGSCQVLEFVFGTVFPAAATLVKAQADLSGQISAADAVAYNLRVVESGSYGYVVVIGTTSTGTTAYFYDLNLNPVKTIASPGGDGVMVDAGGYIVVGSQQLNPAGLSVAGSISAMGAVNSNGRAGLDGFVQGSGTTANNIMGFSMNGATLGFGYYSYNWSNPGLSYTQSPISSRYSSLQITGIFDDGNPAGNAILVLSPQGSGDSGPFFFVTLAKTDFTSTYPANAMDTSPSRGAMDTRSFGYAQGCLFAYDKGSSSFLRMDPATGAVLSSFSPGTDPSTTRFAYRLSGGAFYGFDTSTRVLTKYASWW